MTEAPDRTAAPDRAERENSVNVAVQQARAASSLKPLELVLASMGFIALILIAPFTLLLGGTWSGWLFGAALFVGAWAAALGITKIADRLDDAQAIGLIGIGSIIRALFVFAILFVVALRVDREMALIAAGVFAGAFTADLLGRTMIHALRTKDRKAALKR